MIESLGWRSFVVIYENEESLVRLQEIIKYPDNYDDVQMSLWQLDPDSDDYRWAVFALKNSHF